MKKFTFIFSILFLFFGISVYAIGNKAPNQNKIQQPKEVETLPDDPRVKSGKLANGLTYLLIKNEAEKGLAHFCMAQKTGTVLEEPGQTGMFYMLESLMLKGTRNFAGSNISSYLKSIGIPAENVIFSTGKDNITYLIKSVPVGNDNTVDSTLLILYNWMSALNIDEEDIRSEVPYLKSRMLNEWNADERVDEMVMKQLYPRSRYAKSINPETIAQIENYTSKDLRNFYYKWFRPDFQAVIIAGDIDLSEMETKIKSLFVTIPKPMEKQSRSFYTPYSYDGIKVVIAKDKEYSKTSVSINFVKTPLAAKYRNSSIPFIQEYMDITIARLLADRMRDGIIARNIPISNLKTGKGKFMDIHNSDAFTIEFETLPGSIYTAVSFVNSEIEKLVNYGFSNQEASKYKDIYFRELENIYDNRKFLPNEFYLQRLLNHYYDSGSLASVELKFEIMKQIIFSISHNQLNNYASAMLGQEDNIIITCKIPETNDINTPTEERILTAFNEAGLSTPQRIPESSVLIWPNFTGERNARIVTEVFDSMTEARVMRLSNGATVIFKNNMEYSDTIAFRAVSKGGFSLMPEINLAEESYVNDILNLGGLGQISQPNMERLFSYYNLYLKARIEENCEKLEGYCHHDSFEKLCHAIYLSMVERRPDETAFDTYRQGKIYDISYRSLSPVNIFRDTILQYSYNNKNYVRGITKDAVEKMDYASILEQTRKRFSNAADFYFIFVGNFNEEQAKEQVLKYIGSIPGNVREREDWLTLPNYLTKQNVSKRFLCSMVNPRTYVSITRSYGMPYTLENVILSKLAEQYIRNASYHPQYRMLISHSNITSVAKSYPEEIVAINLVFETDSANAAKMESEFDNILRKAADKKLTQHDFDLIKKTIEDNFISLSHNNSFWLDVMEHRYIEGKDFYTKFLDLLHGITLSDFENFIGDIMTKGNKISIIMDGTTKDVNTQNLFREDEFIKQFFNIE